jgi:PIN domain nuclease of toxin-antitoxin system
MSTAEGRFLLDTHTFVWMASAPERLGEAARERVESPASELLLSVASVWEMAIKSSLNKLELPASLPAFLEEQLASTRTRILDIRSEHAVRIEDLPWHHRDPFDRLLVAQARFESLPLLSRDSAFDAYDVERIW